MSAALRRMTVGVLTLVLVCSNMSHGHAEQRAAGGQPDTFEAASVKLNKSGPTEQAMLGFAPGGQFRAVNVTLQMLIAEAYGDPWPLQNSRIGGGPKWMDLERFDIVATAGSSATPAVDGPSPRMFLMLQRLLAERFKLTVHKEQKVVPIYALIVAKENLGPGLRKSTVQCEAPPGSAKGGTISSPADASANASRPCGLRRFPGTLSGTAITIAELVTVLSQLRGVDRFVADQTKLEGPYDVELKWTPEQLVPELRSPPPGAPPMPPIDPNGPTLFTAVQEQLGLRLNPTKGPVDVLVVDRAELPTDN
ncbi:MAG TPA: TIGR03435 family protein [Vicinamibacterales bacterium]